MTMSKDNKFVDAMDPTRFVKVLEWAPGTFPGDRNLCAVYFQQGKSKVYHGTVEIPARLFVDAVEVPSNQRIGFLPVG
jgi:hypothetical protein